MHRHDCILTRMSSSYNQWRIQDFWKGGGAGWRVAEGHEGVGRREGVPPHWGGAWGGAVPSPEKF